MYHDTECGCGQHGHGEKPEMGYGHGEWRGHHGYPGRGGRHHSGGCCCSCGCHHERGRHHGHGEFMQRRFISKEEIIAKLQEYLKQLQAEAKGVEERIDELKKES